MDIIFPDTTTISCSKTLNGTNKVKKREEMPVVTLDKTQLNGNDQSDERLLDRAPFVNETVDVLVELCCQRAVLLVLNVYCLNVDEGHTVHHTARPK